MWNFLSQEHVSSIVTALSTCGVSIMNVNWYMLISANSTHCKFISYWNINCWIMNCESNINKRYPSRIEKNSIFSTECGSPCFKDWPFFPFLEKDICSFWLFHDVLTYFEQWIFSNCSLGRHGNFDSKSEEIDSLYFLLHQHQFQQWNEPLTVWSNL